MKTVIIGRGEVGRALEEVLKNKYEVVTKDLEDWPEGKAPEGVGIVHVCLNYHGMGHGAFFRVVNQYLRELNPDYLDICSTVPPGTTEVFGNRAVHSTTRGLHPNLSSGLLSIAKHIGGPASGAVAKYFSKAGVPCVTHRKARTTELAHILNNSAYGISLMFADEMSKLCREYGVDYFEAVMKYTATHNEGFSALDHERLVRPILTPPGNRIGGHCVTQGASLIPHELRGPLMDRLANYNDEELRAMERPSRKIHEDAVPVREGGEGIGHGRLRKGPECEAIGCPGPSVPEGE